VRSVQISLNFVPSTKKSHSASIDASPKAHYTFLFAAVSGNFHPYISEQQSQEVIMKLGHTPLSFFTAIILATFLLISATAQAQTESYRARLSPMPTTPQTVSTITGAGEVLLSLNGNTLSIGGNFEGMSSAATMAHVHNGPPAQPGPVVHQLEVSEATAGVVSAELELTDEQVTALRNNSLYIQIHSNDNPAGELRGWIFARN
jgi:hypothetical protein